MRLNLNESSALFALMEKIGESVEVTVIAILAADQRNYTLVRSIEPEAQRFLIDRDGNIFEYVWRDGVWPGEELLIE